MASLASQSRKDLLDKARLLVPPMLDHFHKGQLGRVAVIGGNEDYTGAPYFSAMASHRLGCDMSHIICDPIAAPIIKSYSPSLMVHPLLRSSSSSPSSTSTASQAAAAASSIAALLPRLHVLVIGPGLGRDPLVLATAARVVRSARERGMPIVLDADALGLLLGRDSAADDDDDDGERDDSGDLLDGYAECIVTPNVVECKRLCRARGVSVPDDARAGADDALRTAVQQLAGALGGPTVLAKGATDYIATAGVGGVLASSGAGGRKRSGGQGDTLTGVLGTLLAWRGAYHDGLWQGEEKELQKQKQMSREESLALVAYAGSAITRECSRLAFEDRGRSMTAQDLTEMVHRAFLEVIGEP